MASISILVSSVLLLLFMAQNGESLLCWICSSDLNPACNDPFLPNVTEHFKLENCEQSLAAAYPYMSGFKSVCKKQKKNVDGYLVTLRSCTWKKRDDNTTTCLNDHNTPNASNELCEICNYDGCNGAVAATDKVEKL